MEREIPDDIYELIYDPLSDSYVPKEEKKNSNSHRNFNSDIKIEVKQPLSKNKASSQQKTHKNNSRSKKGRFVDIYIF